MALAERALLQQLDHLVGQIEQPHEVADRDAAAPDPPADLLARQPELLDERRAGARLLDRVQVLARHVLDQRHFERSRRPRARAPAPGSCAVRRSAPRASGARRRRARSCRPASGARAPAAARPARRARPRAPRAPPRRSRAAAASGSARSARPAARAAPLAAGFALSRRDRQDRVQAPPHPRPRLSHARPPPWRARSTPPRPRCGDRDGSPAARSSAPRRPCTLRGITVSKTRSGKCSRTSRSTSWPRRVRLSCIVSSIPATVRPRVQLALDERERLEQPGEPLEREVLRLHRHDHAVGRDERADRQRAERRRAVEQDVLEAARAAAASASRSRCSKRFIRGSSTFAPASPAPAGSDLQTRDRRVRQRFRARSPRRRAPRTGPARACAAMPSPTVAFACGSTSTSSVV